MTGTPIGLAPGIPEAALGQDAAKYTSANPVVRRLIERLLATVRGLVAGDGGTLLDVGVGEGFALVGVAGDRPAIGLEYRRDKLRDARGRVPGLAGVCGDAGMLPFRDGAASTVTCLEVLEHLVAVEPAVSELARVTGGRCILTVPWEPWFRLGNLGRGKNVRRLGNDPEHVQAFGHRSLRRALEPWFAEVEVISSFPWLVAVAARPRRPPVARTG